METFFALLAICAGNLPVTGEFPTQRPVTRSFDVFFDLGLNERLSKQSWGWWFETPSRPIWRHSNVVSVQLTLIIARLTYPVGTRSTLVKLMACRLTAPSNRLSQFRFLISDGLWHSHESNFTVSVQATILYNGFEVCMFKIIYRCHYCWISFSR